MSTNLDVVIKQATNTYANIFDSKWIGLFIFVFSNILTGVVNLTIKTREASDSLALLIMSVYIMVAYYSGYFLYKTINKSKNISDHSLHEVFFA